MSSQIGPFSSRNYRLYFAGQFVSLVGTWSQQVALAWLVITMSKSGTVLGLVVAAQALPILILGPWGGLLADRVNKRKLLLITQLLLAIIALVTGGLIVTKAIEIWMVFALSLAIGIVNSAANPTRQSFISELVRHEHLRSAVSLSSVLVNTARAIGPAVAGVLIAKVGLEVCFFLDAFSYVFVITALLMMNPAKLTTPELTIRANGQIREGFRYVRRAPPLFVPLVMMVLIGTFAYEFQVVLPLVATHVFDGDAGTLGALFSAQGIGAIVGGLYVTRRGKTGIKAVTRGAAVFGFAMALASLAPSFRIELALLFLVGASSVQFLSVANSTLQLNADPMFRGRVLALWSMAFVGSTPIGGPIVGYIAEHFSPRLAMGAGALACFLATFIGLAATKTHKSASL